MYYNKLSHLTSKISPQPKSKLLECSVALLSLNMNIATPITISNMQKNFTIGYRLCANITPIIITGIGLQAFPRT